MKDWISLFEVKQTFLKGTAQLESKLKKVKMEQQEQLQQQEAFFCTTRVTKLTN